MNTALLPPIAAAVGDMNRSWQNQSNHSVTQAHKHKLTYLSLNII
jgi:hypothetical protein